MATWLTDSVLQLETNYPAVTGVPMWLYVVQGNDRSAVVDTCVPSTFRATIAGQLASENIDPRSVTAVLNTHGHPDHFGGNASWLEASDEAEVHAPLADAPWVEDHARHWTELWEDYPCCLSFDESTRTEILENYCGPDTPVHVLLRDDDEVELGGTKLRAVRTGAHSPDHTTFFDADAGLLFTGDVVQGSGQDLVGSELLLAPLYTDPDAYRSGLRRLLGLEFTWMVPAHARPLPAEEGRELINRSLRFVDSVDALLDDLDAKVEVLTSRATAEAIGTRLGPFGGVNLQTAAVARAHLRQRLASGNLRSTWQVSH